MNAVKRRVEETKHDLVDRLAQLERAASRRRKLEHMFDDPSFLDKALKQGRYLRLCAALAWASEREEQARAAIETDLMVDGLRNAMRGRIPTASR